MMPEIMKGGCLTFRDLSTQVGVENYIHFYFFKIGKINHESGIHNQWRLMPTNQKIYGWNVKLIIVGSTSGKKNRQHLFYFTSMHVFSLPSSLSFSFPTPYINAWAVADITGKRTWMRIFKRNFYFKNILIYTG